MAEYPKRNTPGRDLTDRELDCLKLAAEGYSSKEIGDKLEPKLSKRTVDFHLGNAYGKLEVSNRITAVNKAKKLKLI